MFPTTPLFETTLPRAPSHSHHSSANEEAIPGMELEHTPGPQELIRGFGDRQIQTLKSWIKECTFDQRQELIHYISELGKCDIIGSMEVPLAHRVLRCLDPAELCKAAAVSRAWRLRSIDNQIWWQHFRNAKYPLPPSSSGSTLEPHSSDYFFKCYGHYATLARNWRKFVCENFVLHGHGGCVLAMAITGDYVLSGSADSTVRVWNMATKSLFRTMTDHREEVCCLAVNDNATLLASGSYDKTIIIYTLPDLVIVRRLRGHLSAVMSLAFYDGFTQYLFSGSVDKTIRLWNVDTGDCVTVLYGHYDNVSALLLVSSSINVHTHEIEASEGTSTSRSAWLVSGSNDGSIITWNLRNFPEDEPTIYARSLLGLRSKVTCLALYPQIHQSTQESAVYIASVPVDAEIFVDDDPLQRQFSSPILLSATQSDGSISLWSIPFLDPIQPSPPIPTYHKEVIWAITTVPSQMKVITASQDRTLQIWDISEEGGDRYTVEGFDSPAVCCVVNTEATKMCVGTEAGDIVLFDFGD